MKKTKRFVIELVLKFDGKHLTVSGARIVKRAKTAKTAIEAYLDTDIEAAAIKTAYEIIDRQRKRAQKAGK